MSDSIWYKLGKAVGKSLVYAATGAIAAGVISFLRSGDDKTQKSKTVDDWLYDDDDDDDSESLSDDDAALIWMANGKDEDYTFGYTEEELEEAW